MTKGTVRSLIRWTPVICLGLLVIAFVVVTSLSTGIGTPWETGESQTALEIIKRLRIVEILSWSW